MSSIVCRTVTPTVLPNADLPVQAAFDPPPSANVPSGTFVQVPIDTDEVNWANDLPGLAGRIQVDGPNDQLVITEEGIYAGHATVRVNQVGPVGALSFNPFMTDIQIRVNGVVRAQTSTRAADGSDLNGSNNTAPFNNGIVATVPFLDYLQPGDTVQVWYRATAALGGSFPRQTTAQYSGMTLAKVAEVKPELSGPNVECSVETEEVSAPMQATFQSRNTVGGSTDRFVNQVPADWTEIIDEGGDGVGGDIADWGINALPPERYSLVGGREAIAIVRAQQQVTYNLGAPATTPIHNGDIAVQSQISSVAGGNAISQVQRRWQCSAPLANGEGLGGHLNPLCGTFWLNNNPADHGMRFLANFTGGSSRIVGPRGYCGVIILEVQP